MPDEQERFLETAAGIGARLSRDAYWSGSRCTWIGASMEPHEGAWTVAYRTLGADLYGGASGVALFLARLHAATGEAPVRTTAEGALRQAMAIEPRIAPAMRPSFHGGIAGIGYALVDAGEALGHDELLAEGIARLESLRDIPLDESAEVDVVSGVAGAVPALLSVHRRHPSDAMLAAAIRFGEALLARARASDAGMSWGSPSTPDAPHLTGYAHGASGIAHALLELFAVTGDARLRDAALEAFRYERSLFSAAQGNWPDLREHDGARELTYAMGWCHGAPGIGLARARAAELLGDEELRREAEVAARTTAASLPQMTAPPYGNLSLCHGAAGNAELMLQAHRVLGDERWLAAARAVGTTGIERYARAGVPWPGGVTGGGASPSLMLGAAGTGLFYLRLADPEGTPPILLVLPPADEVAWTRRARGGATAPAGSYAPA